MPIKNKWIIFEDDHLLAIDKPSGITVNKAETTSRRTTLEDMLPESDLPRRGIVHRLDKDTSGILLIAKDSITLSKLQAEFKNRKVKKIYYALVRGRVAPRSGTIRLPIARQRFDRKKFGVDIDGKQALTGYRTVKSYKNYTLLLVYPRTGRTHQIRVHLKHIGHPVVADRIYGGGKTFRADLSWCPRLFLHSFAIEFKHPIDNRIINLTAELPDALKTSLKKIDFA